MSEVVEVTGSGGPPTIARLDQRRQVAGAGALAHVPRALTSFIGREHDIEAVGEFLQRGDIQLVTLIGPGGVGKTRLVVEVAQSLSSWFERFWYVSLASIQDFSAVPETIARVLGVEAGELELPEGCYAPTVDALSGLLVLDNAEHLPGIGPFVSRMLIASPNLVVLATSRASLGVSGEWVYPLQPLGVPDAAASLSSDQAEHFEAIRLFVARARAASGSFKLTDRNVSEVAAICRRLDGLPLAIELVASHVHAFTPATLIDRLNRNLPIPRAGPQDQPPRLHSIQQSIAWSCDLLTPGERDTFIQSAVFAGPWTLGAAEGVVRHDENTPPGAVIEHIDQLVRYNLVMSQAIPDGLPHYLLLETVRDFALNLLSAREDRHLVHARLVTWLESRAELCLESIYRNIGNLPLAELSLHIADVERALAWLDDQPDENRLCSFVANLAHLWGCLGRGAEGRPWLERAAADARERSSPYLGPVLVSLACLMHIQGEESLALEYANEGVQLTSPDMYPRSRLQGLTMLGFIHLRAQHMDRALELMHQARATLPDTHEETWVTCAHSSIWANFGFISIIQGEIDEAEKHFNRAIELQTELGFRRGTSHFMGHYPLAGLGDVARARGNPHDALPLYQESLAIARTFDNYQACVHSIGGVAGSLAAGGDWRVAATLFGACEALYRARKIDWKLDLWDRQRALCLPEPWYGASTSFGSFAILHDRLLRDGAPYQAPLPSLEEAAQLWASGASLTMEEAFGLALDAELPPALATSNEAGLSSRELEVLRLIATGASDAEIAAALFISVRTVSNHVRNIRGKLEVPSRAAAAAFAVRHGLA